MRGFKYGLVLGLIFLGSYTGTQPSTAQADQAVAVERATGERLSTAVGHYSRARSLLIAALREFDQGQKLANPSALLDSAKWRGSVLNRAEELERILDPQPRASKGGVKFNADTRLLGEAKSKPRR